jgi:hypothetical protein
MERLTKKELRALLEFTKECYPICDRQTFAQRVGSRLSKIVPSELISHKGSTRAGGMLVRLTRVTLPTLLQEEYLRSGHEHRFAIHQQQKRHTTREQFHQLKL